MTVPISRRKARILMDGLNCGDCREWRRGLFDWTLSLGEIGYVIVGDEARTIIMVGSGGRQVPYRIGRAAYLNSKVSLSLSNGCTLVIPVEER